MRPRQASVFLAKLSASSSPTIHSARRACISLSPREDLGKDPSGNVDRSYGQPGGGEKNFGFLKSPLDDILIKFSSHGVRR